MPDGLVPRRPFSDRQAAAAHRLRRRRIPALTPGSATDIVADGRQLPHARQSAETHIPGVFAQMGGEPPAVAIETQRRIIHRTPGHRQYPAAPQLQILQFCVPRPATGAVLHINQDTLRIRKVLARLGETAHSLQRRRPLVQLVRFTHHCCSVLRAGHAGPSVDDSIMHRIGPHTGADGNKPRRAGFSGRNRIINKIACDAPERSTGNFLYRQRRTPPRGVVGVVWRCCGQSHPPENPPTTGRLTPASPPASAIRRQQRGYAPGKAGVPARIGNPAHRQPVQPPNHRRPRPHRQSDDSNTGMHQAKPASPAASAILPAQRATGLTITHDPATAHPTAPQTGLAPGCHTLYRRPKPFALAAPQDENRRRN